MDITNKLKMMIDASVVKYHNHNFFFELLHVPNYLVRRVTKLELYMLRFNYRI
jgi:hypothetical protein